MKRRAQILAAGLALLAAAISAPAGTAAYVAHEWGTFTTVHAPDGSLLPGLEREEERLPGFVHSHAGFAPADKGWSRPVANVTVKMETPVLYVYAPRPFRLNVAVDFVGGSIGQWYPQRTTGETLPGSTATAEERAALPVFDFAAGFRGSAAWTVDVLPPGAARRPQPDGWETPQWPRARIPAANVLRHGAGDAAEEEGFIFYRGLGNFALPIRISSESGGSLALRNLGPERISFVMVYDKRAGAARANVWWTGSLRGGEKADAPLLRSFGDIDPAGALRDFRRALVRCGLTYSEADAMLATWRESYFEREGLRVFWIVPRAFTDAVLPMRLDPAPRRLERVLVGRSEIITPSFADELRRDFRADGGARWRDHRYFHAYRALAERIDVVESRAPSAIPTAP